MARTPNASTAPSTTTPAPESAPAATTPAPAVIPASTEPEKAAAPAEKEKPASEDKPLFERFLRLFGRTEQEAMDSMIEAASRDIPAPQAGAIGREFSRFLATAKRIIETGNADAALGVAPPVDARAARRAASVAMIPPANREFDKDTHRFTCADGAVVGAITLENGNVVLKALKAYDNIMPNDVFGAKPAEAYRLIVAGAAQLHVPLPNEKPNPTLLQLISGPR